MAVGDKGVKGREGGMGAEWHTEWHLQNETLWRNSMPSL